MRRRRFAGLVLLLGLLASGLAAQPGQGQWRGRLGRPTQGQVQSPTSEFQTEYQLSDHAVVLMFDDGWHCVFTDAYPLLREYDMTAVLPMISSSVREGPPQRSGAPYGYMNRAEVQELIDSLDVEIASHTASHPYLTRLSSEAVSAELAQSKRALEEKFHRPVTSFVYPYGDYDARVRGLVAEAGYLRARSIRPGTVDFETRAFDLPATEVRKSTSVDFVRSKVAGNRLLILFFHRIVPTPLYFTDWSVAQFRELLDWLDQAQVQVVTLEEMYEWHRKAGPAVLAAGPGRTERVEWKLLKEVYADVTGTAQGR